MARWRCRSMACRCPCATCRSARSMSSESRSSRARRERCSAAIAGRARSTSSPTSPPATWRAMSGARSARTASTWRMRSSAARCRNRSAAAWRSATAARTIGSTTRAQASRCPSPAASCSAAACCGTAARAPTRCSWPSARKPSAAPASSCCRPIPTPPPTPLPAPPSMEVTPGLFDHNAKLVERYSVTINHDLPVGRLTSVTGYTKFDTDFVGGYDARAMQAMFGMPAENMRGRRMGGHTTSQDLRWSSRPGASVFWVAGVNLSRAERSFEQLYLSRNFGIDRRYETDSQALYGEVTWPLTNVLKLTGGMPPTWDRKSYDATYGGTVPDARKLRDDYSTGRVALSYALTPTTNLYGAWSRGYESGGIGDHPTQLADSVPYKAASTNAVEGGFKMESASRRFALNGALFPTRVKGDHLLGFDAATLAPSTVNPDPQSRGAELQGVWRLGNGFSLSGGASFIDAEITSNVSGVSGGAIRKGNRSPDVPKWSGSLGVAYTQRLSAFMGLPTPVLNARLDYQYVGTRAADPQNHFDLKKYQKVDLRIGVVSGGTEVYVFGSNLLDERSDLYGFAPTATAYVGSPARGRTR